MEAALKGQCVCMSQVVPGTHRSKGTEKSFVLTEVRASRRKGQDPQWRLGAGLHFFYFTPVDSKQLISKHQKMGVYAARVSCCHQQLFWSKGL